MKPQNLHAHEDRLLDFVYGELPPLEARAVQSHLDGCSRCSELLAGMRGVRVTMAQLSVEPAPDAGLESLLAYAQQAARNAAAGPAPKPTWWRRWLLPMMGATAVALFGVVSVQVNKGMDLKDEVAAQTAAARAEEPASPSPEYAPAVGFERSAEAQKVSPKAQGVPATPVAEPMQGLTPPPPAPAAKLDDALLAKEGTRKKPFASGTRSPREDWSNTGTRGGLTQDAAGAGEGASGDLMQAQEKKRKKDYQSDRRDAMTQSGAFTKPKPILVAPAQGGSAPAAMPAPAEPAAPSGDALPEEVAAEDERLASNEAKAPQQAPARNSLRVGGGGSYDTATNKPADPASDDEADFDDLFGGGKTSATTREQRVQRPAPAPPPPLAASAPSKPSSKAPSKGAARTQSERDSAEASTAELARQADAALRSGNRVREAQLLREALAAGASGKERLGLLNRLCDAEFAIGRRQAALEACALVVDEDPRSSAAQVARRRISSEGLQADDVAPGTGSRGPLKAAPVDKMEAPASSSPVQAH